MLWENGFSWERGHAIAQVSTPTYPIGCHATLSWDAQ